MKVAYSIFVTTREHENAIKRIFFESNVFIFNNHSKDNFPYHLFDDPTFISCNKKQTITIN